MPKKDECDTCVSFRMGNLDSCSYNEHQEMKQEARNEKINDTNQHERYVYTMDLQSVLLSPKSNVSSMYYKTKLVVHNFTLYDLKTADGYCYIWNESEGNLSSDEFSTIIATFIESLLPLEKSDDKIILYSDGCTYQNRNANLSNALLNIAMHYNITIEQKFLEKGHTQMEADSMHSLIERQMKNKTINVPADYIKICEAARKRPNAYKVKYLNFNFFKKFDTVKFVKSIRPGTRTGDPVVTNIRALRYSPNRTIQYKLRFSNNWQDLPARVNRTIKPVTLEELPNLYKERIRITKTKYEHLQQLKVTLPADFHAFYDNLPYQEHNENT